MKNLASTLTWAAVLAVGLAPVASAELISTVDGDITVTESLAPLGDALTYVSGGDGLTGIANCWPTGAGCGDGLVHTPAEAANAADHYWLQFNPAIVWTSSTALSAVIAVAGVDHDPLPYEALEFLIQGSNDGGMTWTTGEISAIYRDAFDTANTTIGHSDDYASLWTFGDSYTMFRAIGGNKLCTNIGEDCIPFLQDTEGEIDALVAPVPEPGTFVLLGLGLAGLALSRRRR